ncbi:biopolymer transporter ExbD [bacterium]|nr:biopolymer transporter ExbD [bacterium]
MAGADLAAASGAAKGKKKHKKKKRLNVRIDMTPMVDVVMLLITFFMLTTVFNTPQTMEINLPPDDKTEVEVAESSLLTLRVLADGSIYWNQGVENAQMVEFKNLHKLLVERLAANPKLICLVKVEREGTYKMMVDIMDELSIANITRFSFAPFKEFDKKFIAKAS